MSYCQSSLRYNYYQPWKLTYLPENWWFGRWDVTWKKNGPFSGNIRWFSGGTVYLVITACGALHKQIDLISTNRTTLPEGHENSGIPGWLQPQCRKLGDLISSPLLFECFIKKNWWIFSTNWRIRGSRSCLFLDAKLDQIWTMDPWCWNTYPNSMNLRNSCDKFATVCLGWVLPIIRRKTHHSCLASTA